MLLQLGCGIEAPMIDRLTLVGWAASLILVSCCTSELQTMLDHTTHVLRSLGIFGRNATSGICGAACSS